MLSSIEQNNFDLSIKAQKDPIEVLFKCYNHNISPDQSFLEYCRKNIKIDQEALDKVPSKYQQEVKEIVTEIILRGGRTVCFRDDFDLRLYANCVYLATMDWWPAMVFTYEIDAPYTIQFLSDFFECKKRIHAITDTKIRKSISGFTQSREKAVLADIHVLTCETHKYSGFEVYDDCRIYISELGFERAPEHTNTYHLLKSTELWYSTVTADMISYFCTKEQKIKLYDIFFNATNTTEDDIVPLLYDERIII